ncbi:hypothetical protein WJX72_011269 [[Myrmecia] bisecta]|uniref:Peptidase S54 rhomboid domain-containing protein n=1 Tax=[Myrmecia] bisecta TaxID=41462 RepID=A0AAW1Q7T6_9CHLO
MASSETADSGESIGIVDTVSVSEASTSNSATEADIPLPQADTSDSAGPGPSSLTEKDAFWELTKGYLTGWVKDQITGQLKKPDLDALGLKAHAVPKVRPRLAYLMLGANLALYGLGLAVGFAEGREASEDYFLALANLNDEIQHGEYYRLLTSTFVHDSFMHLVFNCSALFAIAPQIEAVLGARTFLAIYLLSGLSGSVACFLFSDTITVGASSAIFGLLGAMGGYLWKNRNAQQSGDQLMYIAGIAAINLALGSRSDTQIDNLGHAGGLIAGLCLGLGMAPQFLLPPPTEGAEGSKKDGSGTAAASSSAVAAETADEPSSSALGAYGAAASTSGPIPVTC